MSKRISFLERLSAASETFNPKLALYYRLRIKTLKDEKEFNQKSSSEQGGSGNHKVRLRPRLKETKSVRRLVGRHDTDPTSLMKVQKRQLIRYVEGVNRLNVRCLLCYKAIKIDGQCRSDRHHQIKVQKRRNRKQQQLQQDEASVKTKSKKQRLKEKKQEKKRAVNKRQKEKNAGLMLPVASTLMSASTQSPTNIIRDSTASSANNSRTSTVQPISTNQTPTNNLLLKSLGKSANQNSLLTSTDNKGHGQSKKLSLPNKTSILVNKKQTTPSIAGRQGGKSRSKFGKQKGGKRQYQELGKILKSKTQPKQTKK